MVLHGIEIKRWLGNPSDFLVVSIDGTGHWAEGRDNAYRISTDIEDDTGEKAYVYKVDFVSPDL